MSNPHRRIFGTIRYTSDKPDRMGQERGREPFAITVHADGRRTLQAHSEIDDAPNVMRDVVLSVGADWKPSDCYVRLSVGDQFVGSSWFQFTADEAICEGFTVAEGRLSQRFALPQALIGFGTHPIQGDAWLTHIVDVSAGRSRKIYPNIMMCSLDHRGATGPMLMPHAAGGIKLSFIGRERVTVAAGSFNALHFVYSETDDPNALTRNEPGKHPQYDLWCTDDGDYVFLKANVTGYMMTRYELVEYRCVSATA